MKVVKGDFGECRFIDCIEGMKELKDKEFDLCLTDPPYNTKLNTKSKIFGVGDNISKNAVKYEDNIEDYEGFCKDWFNQVKRITNGQLIHCGKINLSMWVRIEQPRDFLFNYSSNSFCNGSSSWRLTISPIVCYGKHNKVNQDLFISIVTSGFLNEINLIHPCPLNISFLKNLVTQLKPTSIIDPFLGSGTTAEVCEELGIRWLGFEIMEEYSVDIEKRIKRGIRKHSQQTLSRLIE